jgi:hypothetical protein
MRNVCAIAFWLSVALVCAINTAVEAQQPCMTVLECAQKSVDAALAAKAAAEAAKAASDAGRTPIVTRVQGAAKKCNSYYSPLTPGQTDRWQNGQSEVECPANTVRVGGGCSITCFAGFEHAINEPNESNGWRCGVVSNDPTRTFHPSALCMRLGGQ